MALGVFWRCRPTDEDTHGKLPFFRGAKAISLNDSINLALS